MRRRALILAVAGTALAGAGCGDDGGGEPVARTQTQQVDTSIAPPPPTEVQSFEGQGLNDRDTARFARAMTKALRARDERDFLALVDPASGDVLRRQRRWFRNVLRVPLSRVQIHLVGNRTTIDSSGKKGRELTADLGFEHRIRGVDRVDVTEWYRYGFRKRGDQLLVTSVSGAPPDQQSSAKFSRYYPQAWDFGEIAVVSGKRSVVLGPKADAGTMRDIARRTDAAVGATVGRLADRLRVRGIGSRSKLAITLQAPEAKSVFDYFGGTVDPVEAHFEGAAVPIYGVDRKTGIVDVAEGPVTTRIALARTALGQSDFDATLRHEIVHALIQAAGPERLPAWVDEGAAVVLGRPTASELAFRRGKGAAGLTGARALPSDAAFYRGDEETVARHYGMATLAFEHLVATDGEGAVVRRLGQLARGDIRIERFMGTSDPQAFVAEVRR